MLGGKCNRKEDRGLGRANDAFHKLRPKVWSEVQEGVAGELARQRMELQKSCRAEPLSP